MSNEIIQELNDYDRAEMENLRLAERDNLRKRLEAIVREERQRIADALAWFGPQTSAAGCCLEDIEHGMVLAGEVRRLQGEIRRMADREIAHAA